MPEEVVVESLHLLPANPVVHHNVGNPYRAGNNTSAPHSPYN
jgi:hypothetical protein